MKKLIFIIIIIIIILFFGGQFIQQQEYSSKFNNYTNKYVNGDFEVEMSGLLHDSKGNTNINIVFNHKSGKHSLLVEYDLTNYKVFGLFDGKISHSCDFSNNEWNCNLTNDVLAIAPNDIVPTILETETFKITSVTKEIIAKQDSECFNFSEIDGTFKICFNKQGIITKIESISKDNITWFKYIAQKVSNKANEKLLVLPIN